MSFFQCRAPINVQFEVTYRCNNFCVFCYNSVDNNEQDEVDTATAKNIIKNIHDSEVLSLNFNGGEPLVRDDIFELASYAKYLGLDIHLNTNANLIDDFLARNISKNFLSISTTILSNNSEIHDKLSGRVGAFIDTLDGIENLQRHSVYIAVNVVICKENIININGIFDLLRHNHIRTLLLTKYIPCNNRDDLIISDDEFLRVIRDLYRYQEKYRCFDRIALPQPFRLCYSPKDIKDIIGKWNIPCNIGLCTATVSSNGFLTPCNLIKQPVIGNVTTDSIKKLWNGFDGQNFCISSFFSRHCTDCSLIGQCGGGCRATL